MKKIEIIFYRKQNNKSEVFDYIKDLKEKSKTNKDARINYKKIMAYLKSLEIYGTRVGQPIVKKIEGNIWELRPLKNRILFFYWKENKIVLLHHFIKKTKKTPSKELEKARLNLKDFLKDREKL